MIGCNALPGVKIGSNAKVGGDEAFYAVVKTHKCWSKKIYNSKLSMTKI